MSVIYTARRVFGQLRASTRWISCRQFSAAYSKVVPNYLISQSKHLKSADPCPTLAPDTLRLYSMKWCPFAQRTRLALAHKQIRHEEVNVDLSDKPSWLFDKNPAGAVPLLERSDSDSQVQTVIGSLECCEWLEKEYPDTPKLFQVSDDSVGEDVLDQFNQISNLINAYISDRIDVSSGRKLSDIVDDKLYNMEDTMQQTKYMAGSEVSMVDFMIWPTFERLLSKDFKIDSEEMPTLAQWVDNMSSLPAVINVRNSATGYKQYQDSQKSGSTRYDFDEVS